MYALICSARLRFSTLRTALRVSHMCHTITTNSDHLPIVRSRQEVQYPNQWSREVFPVQYWERCLHGSPDLNNIRAEQKSMLHPFFSITKEAGIGRRNITPTKLEIRRKAIMSEPPQSNLHLARCLFFF
jgi:hypothetical protein